MKRGLPVAVAAILIAAAFAAGYALRSPDLIGDLRDGGGQVLAQTPSPPPPSPRGSPSGGRDRGDRGLLTGTVESVQGRTVVVKVTSARGVKADQGAMFTIQVETDASILREIALSDLKKGNTVTVRGTVENGKLVVRQVLVDLK